MLPDNPKAVVATTTFSGYDVVSVIQNENIIGCQFHPENSGENGLEFLNQLSVWIKQF